MVPPFRSRRGLRRHPGGLHLVALCPFALLAAGCASPGAPHPPSLQLPAPVRDLQAVRAGDVVTLHFTAPARTSDDLPLRSSELHIKLCREAPPHGLCSVMSPEEIREYRDPVQAGEVLNWQTPLPEDLRHGTPRSLAFRVEVLNSDGRSAGFSNPVLVAAGTAPPVVEDLSAQGTRRGVLLQWRPATDAGEVLLARLQLDPVPVPAKARAPRTAPASPQKHRKKASRLPQPGEGSAQPGLVWLQADAKNTSAMATLDASAVEGVRYRYIAVRRQQVQVGNHTLELRSADSAPVELAWRDVYPLATPVGLTAIGFAGPETTTGTPGPYAVDLVWEPVDDPRLAGYLISRTAVSTAGAALGSPEPLTPQPLRSPSFHDATALSSTAYRYEVVAVDAKGNRSAPATAGVSPARP